MGKKLFKVFIKPDHKFGKNEYIQGRIVGIAHAMTGGLTGGGYAVVSHDDGGVSFCVKCVTRKYRKFKEIIENNYPGLCEFNTIGE